MTKVQHIAIVHNDKPPCPHHDSIKTLFDRVRRIELLLALLLGSSVFNGVGIVKLLEGM